MSPRSNIAILNEDGTVEMIYCHFDGYPAHHAPILADCHASAVAVREMLALGDMSYLRERTSPVGPHSYDAAEDGTSVFYMRDRGEDGVEAQVYDSLDEAKAAMQEYLYLWTPDGWVYSDHGSAFVPLTADVPAELEE